MLDRVGESEVIDKPAERHRLVITTAYAPLEPPYTRAFFEYAELYERDTDGWPARAQKEGKCAYRSPGFPTLIVPNVQNSLAF